MSHADEKKRRLRLLLLWVKEAEGITVERLTAKLAVEVGVHRVTAGSYINDLKLVGALDIQNGCVFLAEKPLPELPKTTPEQDALYSADIILDAKPAEPEVVKNG